jgi:hypothetical protein
MRSFSRLAQSRSSRSGVPTGRRFRQPRACTIALLLMSTSIVRQCRTFSARRNRIDQMRDVPRRHRSA